MTAARAFFCFSFSICFIYQLISPTAMPAAGQASQPAAASNEEAHAPWLKELKSRTAQLRDLTVSEINSVSPANWRERSESWRQELAEMLGLAPLPEKTPLQAVTVGSFEHDGVKVSRLHYQSRPGLYTTANLYEPLDQAPTAGFPAVLFVCGHANVRDEGRLLGNKTGYHHHGLWFARHGIVCLTIDTIQLGELHGEHHGTYKLGRWDWISRGYTPAGVEAWSGIRGIDYLQSLPNVDKEHIGVTGRSGGGAYSWFIAALDERVKAAVPVAGITDLQNHVSDGCVSGHCDCMYFVNTYGWDYPKLAALVAPRALLLANSDHDTIFPLDGVMRTHRLLDDLYRRLNASDKYGVLVTPGPHEDTQELQVGAFRWLVKHLTGKVPTVDRAALKELKPEQLQVFTAETPANQHVSDLGAWFAGREAAPWKSQDEFVASLAHLWPREAEVQTSAIVEIVSEGKFNERRWRLCRPVSEWSGTILLMDPINATDGNATPFIEVETQWADKPDQAVIEKRLTAVASNTGHVAILFPRGCDAVYSTKSVRDRNHLVRKFYLLGDMPEHVALRDTLSQLATLRTITGPVWNNAELIGRGRSASLAAVTAAVLTSKTSTLPKIEHLRERLPTISGVRLFDTAYDPMVCASLPGLLRFGSYEDLIGLLDKAGLVKTLELTANENETHRLLVDPSSEPQLANGLRIVEVTQDSASVWARATLWPLPNLGDMPEVKFADDEKVPVGRRKLVVLPANGTAGLRYAVPGVAAQLRVRHRPSGGTWRDSEWVKVARDTDYSTLFELADLKPGQEYEVQVSTRSIAGEGPVTSLSGSFRTLPDSSSNRPLTIAIGTCQEFEDRDGDFGMDMYRTMLHRKSDLFVMAGDVVYYDKLARSVPLADYHWQRTYGVPTAVNFHRRVPTIFLKDDHDTYVNDSWPGQKFAWTADFTFEQGQQIFRRQTGLPQPAYRTLTLGPHLQLWFMEGRDYRDANAIPDAEGKTIWGSEQTAWLKKTLADSTAHYKIIVSPTPIVGPDRENKHDNHANDAFATEGKAIRALLAQYEKLVVVCGDRHWQYESADPKTGLREFSVGPFSDRHAGGWDKKDYRPELHRFLRVGGGYLEAAWEPAGKFGKLRLTHLDTRGTEHHTVRFED